MIGFATASFLAFGTLLVIFGTNASAIIAALRLDYAAFGLLGSMLSLGLGAGIVVAGPIVDRTAWRPIYAAACLVVFGATFTLGPDTTYPLLLLHMIAIGLGAGFYETVVNARVIAIFGSAAPRRLLFIHSGAALAACVAPLLFGWLREAFGLAWYDTFLVAGLLHLPLIVAAFVVRDAAAGRGDPSPSEPLVVPSDGTRPADANDRVVLAALCMATFAYVGVETALTVFVVDYVAADLHLDALRGARAISAFWGGLFAGRVVSGLVPRSPGAGTSAALALAASVLVFGFGVVRVDLPELVMGTVGLLLSAAFPVLIGLAGRALPSSPATAVGLAGGLGSLGGFAVPWWTGELASRTNLPFAIASLSGWLLLLASAAAVARVRRAG